MPVIEFIVHVKQELMEIKARAQYYYVMVGQKWNPLMSAVWVKAETDWIFCYNARGIKLAVAYG